MESKIYPALICSSKAVPALTEEIIFHKSEVRSLNLNKFTRLPLPLHVAKHE